MCQKARILDADSLLGTPTLTFYKLLEMERSGFYATTKSDKLSDVFYISAADQAMDFNPWEGLLFHCSCLLSLVSPISYGSEPLYPLLDDWAPFCRYLDGYLY